MWMLFTNPRGLAVICAATLLVACSTMPSAPDRVRKHERDSHLPTSVMADSSDNVVVITAHSSRAERQAKQAAAEFQQALALMDQKNFDEAGALLSRLSTEYPLLSGPVLNLGIVYLHQNEPAKAIAAFKEATQRHPENPYAYLYQGIALRHQGKFKHAEDSYSTALALAPNYAQAHMNLGILYELYLQQPSKALPHYEAYQALQSEADPLVANWITVLKNQIP